jgi:hypothetical protein
MKQLVSIGLGALLVAVSAQGTLFAQAAGYGGGGAGGGMGGAGGGGAFGSSGSAFGSAGGMFGSSGGGSSSAFSSSGFSSNPGGSTIGGANGLVGMRAGGMYGGTGSGGANAAGRTGSNYSSSQYGNRSGGQFGQFGAGQGRAGGGSGRGRTGQTGGQPGQGGTAGNKDMQAWFEPRIDIGFAVTGPAPTVTQTNIVGPFHSPALTSRFGTVNVSVQGGTVILRGTVSSEEDRALAAQMAMLEPSVSSVQNDLKVAVPAANPPR